MSASSPQNSARFGMGEFARSLAIGRPLSSANGGVKVFAKRVEVALRGSKLDIFTF
jgi:hypothetical protein